MPADMLGGWTCYVEQGHYGHESRKPTWLYVFGIAPEDLAKERSFGIRGLHERAATVGGWVDLSSTPGKGASLILTVPLAPDAIDALDDATDFGKDIGNSIWGRA